MAPHYSTTIICPSPPAPASDTAPAAVCSRLARRIRAQRRARYYAGRYLVGAARSGQALALSPAPLTASTLFDIAEEARNAGLSLPVDIYAPATIGDGLTWRILPLPRSAQGRTMHREERN